MTDYDADDNSKKCYDLAVAEKRKRGDRHWPERETTVQHSPQRKELRVRCSGCDHEWVVAYLPMPLNKVADLAAKAACPSCAGSEPIYIAMGGSNG